MEQAELIAYTVRAFESIGLEYMLVGSIAGTSYGKQRFTEDIDFVIEMQRGQVRDFCGLFPTDSFYWSEAAIRDSIAHRFPFNVIHTPTSNKLDLMFSPNNPWGRSQLSRRKRLDVFPGVPGYIASPEDVILGKLWYYDEGKSEKHLNDISGMLAISGDSIDRGFVAEWAAKMGYLETWQTILQRLNIPEK